VPDLQGDINQTMVRALLSHHATRFAEFGTFQRASAFFSTRRPRYHGHKTSAKPLFTRDGLLMPAHNLLFLPISIWNVGFYKYACRADYDQSTSAKAEHSIVSLSFQSHLTGLE
jgi:hypothetical protein